MKVTRINPLWIIFLFCSTILQIVGAMTITNLSNMKFFVEIVLIINIIFIIYCAIPKKVKENEK